MRVEPVHVPRCFGGTSTEPWPFGVGGDVPKGTLKLQLDSAPLKSHVCSSTDGGATLETVETVETVGGQAVLAPFIGFVDAFKLAAQRLAAAAATCISPVGLRQ